MGVGEKRGRPQKRGMCEGFFLLEGTKAAVDGEKGSEQVEWLFGQVGRGMGRWKKGERTRVPLFWGTEKRVHFFGRGLP